MVCRWGCIVYLCMVLMNGGDNDMVVEMLVFILVVVLLMVGDCVVIDMVLW